MMALVKTRKAQKNKSPNSKGGTTSLATKTKNRADLNYQSNPLGFYYLCSLDRLLIILLFDAFFVCYDKSFTTCSGSNFYMIKTKNSTKAFLFRN